MPEIKNTFWLVLKILLIVFIPITFKKSGFEDARLKRCQE